MKLYIGVGAAIALWLFLWAVDIGVLVRSAEERGDRACDYLIGFTIIRDSHSAWDRLRCRLLSRV